MLHDDRLPHLNNLLSKFHRSAGSLKSLLPSEEEKAKSKLSVAETTSVKSLLSALVKLNKSVNENTDFDKLSSDLRAFRKLLLDASDKSKNENLKEILADLLDSKYLTSQVDIHILIRVTDAVKKTHSNAMPAEEKFPLQSQILTETQITEQIESKKLLFARIQQQITFVQKQIQKIQQKDAKVSLDLIPTIKQLHESIIELKRIDAFNDKDKKALEDLLKPIKQSGDALVIDYNKKLDPTNGISKENPFEVQLVDTTNHVNTLKALAQNGLYSEIEIYRNENEPKQIVALPAATTRREKKAQDSPSTSDDDLLINQFITETDEYLKKRDQRRRFSPLSEDEKKQEETSYTVNLDPDSTNNNFDLESKRNENDFTDGSPDVTPSETVSVPPISSNSENKIVNPMPLDNPPSAAQTEAPASFLQRFIARSIQVLSTLLLGIGSGVKSLFGFETNNENDNLENQNRVAPPPNNGRDYQQIAASLNGSGEPKRTDGERLKRKEKIQQTMARKKQRLLMNKESEEASPSSISEDPETSFEKDHPTQQNKSPKR